MASGSFRFDHFALDPGDRQLRRNGVPVELNARYLDALILLVRERGKLVSKERFLDEVWRGVPVTDEALTQCIKTLRKQLRDDAGRPRFIETAPKHGYRFIAPVEWLEAAQADGRSVSERSQNWRELLRTGAAGAIGGGAAGIVGGVLYSIVGVVQPGAGAASALLVLMCITMLIGVLGGAGVGLGIAAADLAPGRLGQWKVLGGALGGFVVGGLVKLLGVDTFNLLLGQTPGEITGAPEGAMLGGAVGLAAWLASGASIQRGVAVGAATGAAAGVLIHLLGGRLMAGSLDLLATSFPSSRLQLDQLGRFFGETEFGPITQAVAGGLEGALFGACLIGALIFAQRRVR